MCINKEKLCHGILSHVEKHNKLHDLSDSNGHSQRIMSISFNCHIKRQKIRSIYHIKTIFVLDSIDFKIIRFDLYHGGQSPRCAMGHLLGFPVRVCWQCGKYGELADASQKSVEK